jgi:hypothetical protein
VTHRQICALHAGVPAPCAGMQQQLPRRCAHCEPLVHNAQADEFAFCVCTGFLLAAGFVAWWVRRRRVQCSSKECATDVSKLHFSAQLLTHLVLQAPADLARLTTQGMFVADMLCCADKVECSKTSLRASVFTAV